MPNPRKSAEVIEAAGAAHKTKEELTARKKAEQAALTGEPLKETTQVKENKMAHQEFLRMRTLLKEVKKNDDIYRNIVNRYCMLYAECIEFTEKRESIYRQLEEFCQKKNNLVDNEELTYREAYKIETEMQANIIAFDRQIQTKRKMMLDIEKENGWTIKASLQTIPPKREIKANPLKEALKSD